MNGATLIRHCDDQPTTMLAFLKGKYFTWWKARMKDFS